MTSPPLAAVLTLGCKLNLADSDEIAHGLRGSGFRVVDRLCDADAYVVNTCSVTHVADRKARRLIRAVRRMAPGAPVAVTGCYPRTAGEAAIRDLGADLVVGTRDTDKHQLVAFLTGQLSLASPVPTSGASAQMRISNSPLPEASHASPLGRGAEGPKRTFSVVPSPEERSVGGEGLTRAFVKAQEGCNDVCAFCIVPRTRGREESREPAAVIREVERALDGGAREVVITGTQLGAWGRDLAEPRRPHQLIAAILDGAAVPRLRFSSLQPQDITPELLALWDDPRLMPHFHLALQSGSQPVLERMRRRYSAAQFLDAAARIRAAVPDVAITTDVIAGFPGETEAQFEETLALCREVGFARIHAFPYSLRSRTAAAAMEGRVAEPLKRERMNRLLALGQSLAASYQAHYCGSVRPVLWEQRHPETGRWSGLTDNYIRVYASGGDLFNRITPARLGDSEGDGVSGDISGGIE